MWPTAQFNSVIAQRGTTVRFHREEWTVPCPCRTPEGERDPEWHLLNPGAPVCNAEGMLSGDTTDVVLKAWVQPIQSTRATRLSSEYLETLFPGEIQADDHLGIFPVVVAGTRLEFRDWSQEGEDWIQWGGRQFIVVNANLFYEPTDGNIEHHWELGLRLFGRATDYVAPAPSGGGGYGQGGYGE